MQTMTQNILRWDGGSEGVERLKSSLRESGSQGKIKRLTFMYSSVSFDYTGDPDEFVRQLSKENPELFLTHQKLDEDLMKCTSARWENGTIVLNDTPLNDSVNSQLAQSIQREIKAGRDCVKFRAVLDSCWEKYRQNLRGLGADELIACAREIAAAEYCYKSLRSLPFRNASIGYLLQFADPLEVVRDEWLEYENCDKTEEFDHVLWYIADRHDAEQDYEMVQPGSTEISM